MHIRYFYYSMNTEIDQFSGFCFGVVNAIKSAEEVLKQKNHLYCLGDIVHNNEEVSRLEKQGLVTIDHEQFKELKNCTVLLRAHGEPPEVYRIAKENNIELVDASCPVVLKLQSRILKGYNGHKLDNGQIVIFGKEGHAEVNGLVGQADGDAIVIGSLNDLDKIDFSRSVTLFSQTTQSPSEFQLIKAEITKRTALHNVEFKCNNTICGQVSKRGSKIKDFAEKHDLIIFVSSIKSSNGKVLFEICKSVNSNSQFISNETELSLDVLNGVESVGICGATSTPRWLMDKVYKVVLDYDKTLNN